MSQNDIPYTFDRVFRLALAAGSIWLTVLLLSSLSDVLLPFAVALTLAYLLNPLVELTGRIIKNRMAAVVVTLTVIIVPVGKLLCLAMSMVGSELSHIGKLFAILVNDSAAAKRAAEYLPADIWKFLTDLAQQDDVRQFLSESGVANMLHAAAQKALPGIWNLVSGSAQVFAALAGVFVIILYLVFLLADYDKLRSWRSHLPEKYRARVSSFIDEFTNITNRYFRTQALIALIIGCLFSAGFMLIDLPLAILLGLLIGLLNMVPYLQIAGLVPAFLFAGLSALATGGSLWGGFAGVAAVFAVVQIIQDAVLVPKLQGESLGLSPWMILLSLSVWGKLLGFLGLVMALPLSCMALAVYRQYTAAREKKSFEEADINP
ncbi:Predicted PurR-regulated permease PerM [Maridesulfovibrio ferrireducens]|uniref:Predicted PurR-regulated permease PerM n=1 Tax=Maridesulfovibrio ferrireducens TaxID=246191 RepID=A0A1G9JTN8_9BACT|nr:AI-2E family transporter [Maridesulfovibrio ferrireducens]SDL40504.1 Predicted PurR-regulated permease PerM [Maridesulfovibrio ferrireducens]